MRLLLDTHIWIWSLLEPSKLRPGIRRALTAAEAELWLSPISVWEFLTLCDEGRIQISENPPDWIAKALQIVPMKEAPLTHEVALMTRAVNLPHRDPADRFLAATALVHGLTLVTSDRRLIDAARCRILANR